MGVLIDNSQNNYRIALKKVREKAQGILDDLECPDSELSILIVDDPQIAALNKTYFNREGPTNVIAFPMREGDFSKVNPQLLGDVVISADTARREAKTAGISTWARFQELLVHGILHLLGYDHEASAEEERRMEEKSAEVLGVIGGRKLEHRTSNVQRPTSNVEP